MIGPVELLQYFAVRVMIGADHVERNGHRYFIGLHSFLEEIQETILAVHGDPYRHQTDVFAALDVDGDTVDLNTTVDAAFDVAPLYDTSQFTPLHTWLSERNG